MFSEPAWHAPCSELRTEERELSGSPDHRCNTGKFIISESEFLLRKSHGRKGKDCCPLELPEPSAKRTFDAFGGGLKNLRFDVWRGYS